MSARSDARRRSVQNHPRGRRRSSPARVSSVDHVGRRRPERRQVGLDQRRLVRGGAQVGAEDVGVGRVEDRGLDRLPEQRLRVVDQIGVQRVVPRDQDRQGVLGAPTRPADLLPQRGAGAGEAGHQDGVQSADVDPELQGVGGGEPDQLAAAERDLDLAAFLGQVATAVRRHPRRQRRVDLGQVLGRGHRDLLGAAPRPDEREGPHVLGDQVGEQICRLGRRGAPDGCTILAGVRRQRRLPQSQRDLAAGRRVVRNGRHVQTSQPSRGHGRIGHRRRRQDERRMGAVQRADPAQPAQHVRHVRTEHAAVVVALVDDDVLQRTEEPRPTAVPRQERTVQHVRVGQDVLAVVARPVPLFARTVTVVSGHAHVKPQRHQPCELILGQRLRGREVEHARATLTAGASSTADRGQRGELVGERFPGGGSGRQHDVVTGVGGVGGRDLVPPRALDPACGVRRAELVRNPAPASRRHPPPGVAAPPGG